MNPDEPTNIFESIPSDYGGGGTAVLEPPTKVEKPAAAPPEKKEEPAPAKPVEKAEKVDTVEGTEKAKVDPPETDDDLLASGEKQAKTPAQFAAERRERKQKSRELLEAAPKLEEENRTLKAELEELRAKVSDGTGERALESEEVKALRSQLEAERKRYVSAYAPQVSPYEDEQVQRYASQIEDALKANIPRFAMNSKGEKQRIDLGLMKREPERKAAIDQAVLSYAMAAEGGDAQGMDRAVVVLGTALGNLDLDDEDTKIALDTALSKASEPAIKGVARFKEVQGNAVHIAAERRAAEIAQTEARLLSPLRMDPEAISATLEKDPGHGWANFGALLEVVPEEVVDRVEQEIQRDAAVIGAMRFQPPPLAPNATAKEIEEHELLLRAGSERASKAARYLAVGRMMIDGGILAHLRSEAAAAEARKEEAAGSLAIPSGGGGGSKSETGKGGAWDSIPSNYGR